MVRGYLAEAYDGIGQHVLVTLAKSSTAAAYKARIASGDFGSGTLYPIGTPVHIVPYRGKLEIHLGGHPGFCGDRFNRLLTSSTGWGQSDLKSSWLRLGVGSFTGFSVNGGEGVWEKVAGSLSLLYLLLSGLTFPVELLIRLRSDEAPSRTTTFWWRWWINSSDLNLSVPSSDSQYVNVRLGAFGNEQGMRMDITAYTDFSGIEDILADTGANGQFPASPDPFNRYLWQRILFESTRTSAKAWFDGTAEPAGWDLEAIYNETFTEPLLDIAFEGAAVTNGNKVSVDEIDVVQGLPCS